MGYGHDNNKTVSDADERAAMQPVSIPLPKAPASESGNEVATDRAPSSGELLDPKRPSMEGVESVVVIDSITDLVEDIYNEVLLHSLEALKPQLAETPAPTQDADWAWKLIGVAVQIVATATLSEIGGLAAKRIGAALRAVAKPAADASSSLSKDGGKAAASWVQSKGDSTASRTTEPELDAPVASTGKLVDDFVERTRTALIVRKHDAIDALRIIKASAAKQNPKALAGLDGELRAALQRGELQQWFQRKVALEWANFLARLSLGPRPQGQTTNMIGANTIGGFHEAGAAGVAQWRGGHDGFVDITIDVSSGTPTLISANVENRPGVADVLKYMGTTKRDEGSNYTLGTLPMFRRVWLKTGDSKLETSPAFVITPEGALEVNYDDPVLATIGGAKLPPNASAYDVIPDGRRDANAWAQRGERAASALAGAHRLVTTVLNKPEDVRSLR